MTSSAHVIKTRLPNPPPSADVLLKSVHAAVGELKSVGIGDIALGAILVGLGDGVAHLVQGHAVLVEQARLQLHAHGRQ